jgi:branched-chain amino acid transport system substrate-binding protein
MFLDGNFPTTYFGRMPWRFFCRTAFALLLAVLSSTPSLAQQPATVGAALPLTGILADLAADYRKGLVLWQEEVNAAGGLLGRRVELKIVDDASESSAAGRLYEQLIKDQADVLVGPFGSAASLGAAAAAERGRRVLLNATGAARVVHRASYRYVFQLPAPLGSYGRGALGVAREMGLQKVLILAREDPNSRESAMRAREEAVAMGLAPGEIEVHARGNLDFGPQISRARAAGTDAWIAFGLLQDAAEMTKSFRKQGYTPKLFVAQGAAEPEFLDRVGQDAEGAIGISAYERRAATRGNAAFVTSFAKRWSSEAGPAAAEGYAAGKLLEAAAARAGTLEQEKLREALGALETHTVLGAYKVDRNGVQQAAQPLLLQVQRGRREIVWPAALATAKLQPYLPWRDRKPLK